MKNKTDLFALSSEHLVDILAKSGFPGMTIELLQQDVANEAPQNADGTFNFIHYMAWMIKGVTINGNESN